MLVEVVVALALGALAIGALASVVVSSSEWIRVLVRRSEALSAVGTVSAILDEELRVGRFGVDWIVVPPDVVSLRAFRGLARVCGGVPGGASRIVEFRGHRSPDPARDSVLVLGTDGEWRAFDLVGAESGTDCVGFGLGLDGTVERWEWHQPGMPDPLLARLFERGSYHLAAGAFRYRLGAGGRQPLTPEIFGSGSAFSTHPTGVRIRLEVDDRGAGPDMRPFEWMARGNGGEP